MRHLASALVVLASASAVAGRTTDYEALDVHALLASITDAQRAEFDIEIATWKESAPAAPPAVAIPLPHAYLVGSLEGASTYDANGTLLTDGLAILPTTYVVRLPAVWNGRLLFFAPGGTCDHRTFNSFQVDLLAAGYAIAVICHAFPDNPGLPYAQFIEQYRTHEMGASAFAISHKVKDLLGAAFARPRAAYMLSFSGGTLFNAGLIAGRRGNPIDGFVMFVGGNGWRTETEEHILGLKTGVIPLTGQAYSVPVDFASQYRQATLEIGLADPEYRASMMARLQANDFLGARALFLAYRVEDRPAAVQRAWDDLRFEPDIQAPVIVVQGTADTTQFVRNSLVYAQAVIVAGHSERFRIYIVPGHPHGPPWPPGGVADSVHKMARWVEEGIPPEGAGGANPPEAITFGAEAVLNNWATGYPDDPCGYFHHQFDPQVVPPASCGL